MKIYTKIYSLFDSISVSLYPLRAPRNVSSNDTYVVFEVKRTPQKTKDYLSSLDTYTVTFNIYSPTVSAAETVSEEIFDVADSISDSEVRSITYEGEDSSNVEDVSDGNEGLYKIVCDYQLNM